MLIKITMIMPISIMTYNENNEDNNDNNIMEKIK